MDHREAVDLLEPFVLEALAPDESEAVRRHVGGCDSCRAHVAELGEVVLALPEGLSGPDPDPALRRRILEAARLSAPPARRWIFPRASSALRLAPLVAGLIALIAVAAAFDARRELDGVRGELREYQAIAEQVSQGGRWWYMAGVDQFAKSGASLIASSDRAVVVFHDLSPLDAGAHYAVWLIAADGRWVRAANFVPTTRTVQSIALSQNVDDFVQCAVTVETSEAGRRAGPLVMQSRVFSQ
jgi:hypothetical protein